MFLFGENIVYLLNKKNSWLRISQFDRSQVISAQDFYLIYEEIQCFTGDGNIVVSPFPPNEDTLQLMSDVFVRFSVIF